MQAGLEESGWVALIHRGHDVQDRLRRPLRNLDVLYDTVAVALAGRPTANARALNTALDVTSIGSVNGVDDSVGSAPSVVNLTTAPSVAVVIASQKTFR